MLRYYTGKDKRQLKGELMLSKGCQLTRTSADKFTLKVGFCVILSINANANANANVDAKVGTNVKDAHS